MILLSSTLGSAVAALLTGAAAVGASPFPARADPLAAPALFSRQASSPIAPIAKQNTSSCGVSNGTRPDAFSPALYTEPYRNQLGFSPTASFMNDPNGLVYRAESKAGADDALWMMSYQYAYNQTTAGNQHWGLATSKDALHWEHHAPIIAPDLPGDGIFSGSSVVDANNTSGFFNESIPASQRLVAVYTLNTNTSQTQHIAYTLDGGFTYTKFQGPGERGAVLELNQTQFRDPKVHYDVKTQKWVMTVSLSQHFQVLFFSSPDLKNWTQTGSFGNAGFLGYQYECPALSLGLPVVGGPQDGSTADALIVSINPGAASQGGSFIQYFLGEWNGTNFTSGDTAARLLEFGPDSYAAQEFDSAPNGEHILLTWASNWNYGQFVPTSPWRSTFALPRKLELRWHAANPQTGAYYLTQQPVDLSPIQGKTLTNGTSTASNVANQTVQFEGRGGFDVNVTFTADAPTSKSYGSLTFSDASGSQSISVGVLMGLPATVYVDRRNASSAFADTTPLWVDRFASIVMPTLADPTNTSSTQSVKLRAIIDKSLLELYAEDGVAVATTTFYFDNGGEPASVTLNSAAGVAANNFTVNALHSTWDCFVETSE